MEEQLLSLGNLGDGAAIERFDLALQDALNNIQDVNTDPKKPRQVTMKVTITPDENRGVGKLVVDVDKKVLPPKPFGITVFMGKDKGGAGYAIEAGQTQPPLFAKEDPAEGKVYPLKKEAL
jgi:hypothetical protein